MHLQLRSFRQNMSSLLFNVSNNRVCPESTGSGKFSKIYFGKIPVIQISNSFRPMFVFILLKIMFFSQN